MTARPRAWLAFILIAYLVITLGYSVFNPLFEAPDEHWHYFTAQSIADTGHFPYVADVYDEWLSQEAAQPPLYYLLGALLIAPVDTAEARQQVWPNPFTAIGDASALTNVNRFVHTAQEAWPWQGYALAAHLLRAFSAVLGVGTLLFIYGSGRLLWPADPRPALLATALVAFLPQFNFVHSAISNDSLITLLCAAATWQMLRQWLAGVTRPRLLLLGVTIGLAALTKNAGILLLFYAVGVLGLLAWRERRFVKGAGETAVFVILPTLLIAGWLWWRNWLLYGDITATNQFIRLAGGDRGYTLPQVLAESGGLWLSFFALFGWFNLRPPDWVYWVWNSLVALAIVGAVIHRYRSSVHTKSAVHHSPFTIHGSQFTTVLMAAWPFLVYAGLVTFMLRTPAAQGRLLFPALVPLALGLANGLSRWRRPAVYWLAPLSALATTLYALLAVIPAAYARPPLVTALPATATPLAADLGQGVELVGMQIETETAEPGDLVWLTFYWRAEPPPADPPELKVSLLGRGLTEVAQLHSYHGRGLYPANLWPPGAIIADRFAMRLDAAATAPVLARLFVGLVESGTMVNVGAVKVMPPAWPTAPDTALAQIGEGIVLAAVALHPSTVSPGETVTVDVTWRVTADITTDYTTLIHLAELGQPPLATGDRPPLNGEYPSHVWTAGEVIVDQYRLVVPPTLPAGRYPVWLGLYDSATITRLPLLVDGRRQPGDVYEVGWLLVTR